MTGSLANSNGALIRQYTAPVVALSAFTADGGSQSGGHDVI